jgi:hypothetical protein
MEKVESLIKKVTIQMNPCGVNFSHYDYFFHLFFYRHRRWR